MINTVVFDFVNTLAYLNPKREDVIYNFLTEKDINISKSKIVDALKIADDQCHYSCFEIVDLNFIIFINKNNTICFRLYFVFVL